jgi:hypothetical protein
MPEETVEEVAAIAGAYEALHRRDDWNDISLACDLWTWAFFAPLQDQSAPDAFPSHLVPTTSDVKRVVSQGPKTLDGRLRGAVTKDAQRIGFFHWSLQFPEVFTRPNAGFDVVLSNPPWERIKLQAVEFFAARDSEIAASGTASMRKRLIAGLVKSGNPKKQALHADFLDARRASEAESIFMRYSERFPLGARGDVNTFSVFTELAFNLLQPRGLAGLIVPDGIATSSTTAPLFGELVSSNRLRSLYGFKNERFLFRGIEHNVTYALITLGGAGHKFTDMEFC